MRHICKGEDEEGRSRDLKRKRQSRILRDPATDLPNNMPHVRITGLGKIISSLG